MHDGQAEEGAGAPAAALAGAGCGVGGGRADPGGAGPAEAGSGADRPARGARCDDLPGAERVSVEPAAGGVPGRQLGPPDDAAVDRAGGARADLGGGAGGVRGPGRVRLGVAGGGRRAAEGPPGGKSVGPNPTDRGKPGVKQSLLVEADGGPLAITIAGANVPDAQRLDATIEAVVLERPEPEPDFEQHLCLDKAYDNEQAGAPASTTSTSPTSR